jgi:hypothetical protein
MDNRGIVSMHVMVTINAFQSPNKVRRGEGGAKGRRREKGSGFSEEDA